MQMMDLLKNEIKDDAVIHQGVQLTANAAFLKKNSAKFFGATVRGLLISGLLTTNYQGELAKRALNQRHASAASI